MRKYFILGLMIALSSQIYAQNAAIKSGPLVGYVDVFETMLWVQITQSADVKIAYWPISLPQQRRYTNTVRTLKGDAFVAKLIADTLTAGTKYQYEVIINNVAQKLAFKCEFKTPVVWKYRTDPPDFKFATGSCAYINDEPHDRSGKPYGGDYQIFRSIANDSPELMLWLGDNIYLRGTDWNSWTGITYRYTHTRSIPEMQPLLASTPNYAIWDDHDAGPNDCDRGFYNIDLTLKAFHLFWANPTQGVKDIPGAISMFSHSDADFFMLDNRYHRTPDFREDVNKTILGEQQLQWFLDALVTSEARFKFVMLGGQFLTTAKSFETYVNYGFEKERQIIIDFIKHHKIKNVIFITGDRHHTELSAFQIPDGPVIYDLTVSPLTSGPSTYGLKEVNETRVEGTVIQQRNYATFQISGTPAERKVLIEIKDVNGKVLWNKTIIAESLK